MAVLNRIDYTQVGVADLDTNARVLTQNGVIFEHQEYALVVELTEANGMILRFEA